MRVRAKCFDHLSYVANIDFDGEACLPTCSFYVRESSLARCLFFDISLRQLGTSGDEASKTRRCSHCLNVVKEQMARLSDDSPCSVVMQRNLVKANAGSTQQRLESFEVELNTVLRGYNEFRLTFTNEAPKAISIMGAGVTSSDTKVVAPLILDLGEEEEEGTDD